MDESKAVLVAVDASPESARAAALGWAIAGATHARFQLVHVVPDPVVEALSLGAPPNPPGLQRYHDDDARDTVEGALRERVPQPVVTHLELHRGKTAAVVAELAREAGLVVIGGKRHGALSRWLTGSTAHALLPLLDTPLLVAGPANTGLPRRVLAAVDLSAAASPTLTAAGRFAASIQADFGMLHVVEPVAPAFDPLLGPGGAVLGIMNEEERAHAIEDVLQNAVWPDGNYPYAERIIRHGAAAATIAETAREWHADVIVVGSHGGGFLEHLVSGNVPGELLSALPASLLVVPSRQMAAVREGVLPFGAPAWA